MTELHNASYVPTKNHISIAKLLYFIFIAEGENNT